MLKIKKTNLVMTVIFTLALYSSWVYAGGYSWTDKDGVRHSSDLSPSEYMKQKKKASQQTDDELSPEVTQTLFNKKRKPVSPEPEPETGAKKAPIAPDDENKQAVQPPSKSEYHQTKQKITPSPKDRTPAKKQVVQPPSKSETPLKKDKSTAPLKPKEVKTHKKKAVLPPVQAVQPTPAPPQPLSRKRISFYKNQIARLKELIKSQEKLIAEDVRTIGLIENRINQIKHTQGPKSDRLKNELRQSEKSLPAAKNRLKSDVRELQVLQSNVNNYQLKLKSAR